MHLHDSVVIAIQKQALRSVASTPITVYLYIMLVSYRSFQCFSIINMLL